MPVRHVPLIAAALLVLGSAATAHAGGLELMPGGAHSVGRGGAVAARSTNAMALLQNPAGLVDLTSDQMILDFDTAFHDMCVEPYGYYGWGVYLTDERAGPLPTLDSRRSEFGDPASSKYGRRELATICNSAQVAPLPQVAFAFRLTDKLSLGFGFVAPVLIAGQQYGGKDGTIEAGGDARPTPTRYQLVRQEVLFALNPTAAVSYRVLPALSVGVALQVTMASLRNHSVVALQAGTSPAEDMFSTLAAHDYFMPALTFAVQGKPLPRVTVMGAFTWNDGLHGSGDLTFTTNTFHQGATGSEFVPLKNDPLKLNSIRVELPWTATVGVRYAQPLAGVTEPGDPLDTEVWDLELDATYTFQRSANSANRVDVGHELVVDARRANGTPQSSLRAEAEDLSQLSVETHQLNALALRLGASYHPLPGKLGLSGGAFVESRGTEVAYASVENFAAGRLGFGLGVLMRFGSIDLSAAYAHVFQEELTVAPPDHEPRQAASDAPDDPTRGFDQRIYEDGTLSARPRPDPDAPSVEDADAVASWQQPALLESAERRRRVVNAGRYTASYNVISVALAYRF